MRGGDRLPESPQSGIDFFQLEFLPFPDRFSYDQRQAFSGRYNSALFADNDHFLYGMAGISLKF